jgi:parallel beta-helix repeat protein
MYRKKNLQKTLAVGILLAFLLATVVPMAVQKANATTLASTLQGKVLHVGGSGPGNYTRIQDAVNDSSDGDTVYVYDDSSPYHEHLVVQHSVTLLGENETTTEINGSGLDTALDTVNITGTHVTLSGFRITSNHGYYYQAAVKVTGAYAIISNCTVSRNGWVGIYLYGSGHCQLRDCTLSGNLVAVYLVGSRSNTIRNCTCSDNSDAITLYDSSDNNQLINCTCTNNGFDNIHIQQSSGNHLIDCVCENGYDGISLAYAPGTSMHRNTMTNNYANFGIGSPDVADFDCEIDTSNTINGKPMYYLLAQQDLHFDETMDIGFLGLVGCSNISVRNLEFTNNFEGMLLVDTTHSLIENCSFRNNDGHGMYLISCSNDTVRSCVFQNSFFDGVFLYTASRNTLENCSYAGCIDGVSLDSSHANTIKGQTVNQCSVGISLDSSKGNTLKENNMDHCGLKIAGNSLADFINFADTSNVVNEKPLYYVVNESNLTIPSDAGQVILVNCTGCNASKLNLSAASVGIELAYAQGNTIAHNILNQNSVVAIYLDGSNHDNIITDNGVQENNYGVDVVFSHDNLLQGNRFTKNGLGVALHASGGNALVNNTIKDGSYGIYLDGSSLNTMRGNTIDNTSIFGVYLLSSDGNVLSANTMVNCSLLVYGTSLAEYLNDVDPSNTVQGKPVYYYLHKNNVLLPSDAGEVVLVDCSGCTVRGLSLSRGTTGVVLAYSSNNSIIGNTVRQQSLTALDLSSGSNNDNTIQGNVLDGNGYGIDIENSFGTTVKRNRIVSNYYGIFLYQALRTTVRRNTLSNNYYGISARATPGSTFGFNNIFKNYIFGLSVDACSVVARWNWWGALTGPGGKGDHIGAVNHGSITYVPWRFLPVLLAGRLQSLLVSGRQKNGIDPQGKTPWATLLDLPHTPFNGRDSNKYGSVRMKADSVLLPKATMQQNLKDPFRCLAAPFTSIKVLDGASLWNHHE